MGACCSQRDSTASRGFCRAGRPLQLKGWRGTLSFLWRARTQHAVGGPGFCEGVDVPIGDLADRRSTTNVVLRDGRMLWTKQYAYSREFAVREETSLDVFSLEGHFMADAVLFDCHDALGHARF